MDNTKKAGMLSMQGEFCRISKGGDEYKVIYLKSKRFVIARFSKMVEALAFCTDVLGAPREQVLFNTYL